jgi:myo-inositol 2-dehydrogenase / D-chiro-inositol 1-dehydrogenase
MASREPVRLAVIGAGRMGRTHLRALARTERVTAAAVVEPVAAVREALAVEGFRAWASIDELLEHERVDGALVAAPTDLHLELVTRLAASGIPILCEKPCGLRAEDTREAVRTAADAGVLLQVGYWRRFVPALLSLRERLAAGAFGEPLLISCWQWDAQPPAPSFRERSGGIMLDMGVHELDQLRWLTGSELGEIVALADDVDADVATALVRVDDGTNAVISLGRQFPHGDCCWVELMGRSGHARELFMWGEDGQRVFQDALVAQAEAFAAAVRGEPQRGASGEDAIRAIEAAERAARSLAPAPV